MLRVAVLALPFLLAAGAAAVLALRDRDINYYLSYHPPEFLLAAMAVLLVWRLSGWLPALHLRVIDRVPARDCFAQSELCLRHRRGSVLRLARTT